LHHAGYSADAQGCTHQAGQGGVEGCVGQGEDVGGEQCQEAAAPGWMAKTGFLGFLWFFSVAEKFFLVTLIDPVGMDGHF
jgi:hypothetical protein